MATYLEICQAVARESGTVSGNQPSAVTGQTGLLLKIVNWVSTSWVHIQNDRNAWRFMRREFEGATTAGTQRYTGLSFGLTDFAEWGFDQVREPNFTIYKTSTGKADEGKMSFVPWPEFRAHYLRGVVPAARPVNFTVDYDNQIVLGPTPDDAYTITGEYVRTPQILVNNDDVPICSPRHHDAIKWLALMRLAQHDEANAAYAVAAAEYGAALNQMERDLMWPVSLGGGALA